MKALILAGGRGRRLKEESEGRNKCMLQVKGKPLLEYSLDCAVKTNVSEIVILVGYMADEIMHKYKDRYKDKPVKYARQPEQKGLVHAIECAAPTVGGEDFMLMLGDELLVNPRHKEMVAQYEEEKLFGLCGFVLVDDSSLVSKTYAIIASGDKRIIRLIEKPERPWNTMMGTGNCIFKAEIFSYIAKTPINQKRGEKELVDLIQSAVDEGRAVKPFMICDKYINVNSGEELGEAKSYFAHL